MSAFHVVHTSAESPTLNLGNPGAPANVTAVGPALSQYSEPHSPVEPNAYDARSAHTTGLSLLPHLPVNTVEDLNKGILEMRREHVSKRWKRKAGCRVKKARRSGRKVDLACERCRSLKTKCGGQQPSCDECVLANTQCSYSPVRHEAVPTPIPRWVRGERASAVSASLRASERKPLPRPEQRESPPSPPEWRNLPHPGASLPAASGFGGSAVGFGGGPSLPGFGIGYEQITSGLEAEPPEQGPGYAESNWGFGGSLAQLDQAQGYYNQQAGQNFRLAEQRYSQAEQRYPQIERYDQQPQGYHPSLPLLREATRVGSAQSHTPRLRTRLVEDCTLPAGNRAVRVRCYAKPAGEVVVLEVDGSFVHCDGTLPFTWADFAAWPPEPFRSVDGLVFGAVA